jgi:hypothetical protein
LLAPEGDTAAALAICQPGDGRRTQTRDVSDVANSEIDGQFVFDPNLRQV